MLLLLHVGTGIAALGLGAVLLGMRKTNPWHSRLGEAYHWIMLVICVSAVAVSISRGRATFFTYLAPPSYAQALLGYVMAKRRPAGWLRWHISGQAGSYIALVSATLIQFVPRMMPLGPSVLGLPIAFWGALAAPIVAGSVLIAKTQARWAPRTRKRPVIAPVESALPLGASQGHAWDL